MKSIDTDLRYLSIDSIAKFTLLKNYQYQAMKERYKPDLAYIYGVGHQDYALKSAPAILAILAQHQLQQGLVIDLGCGSGLSAQVLMQAGYQVLGIDISEAMIAIARTRVPAADFRVESLFRAELSTCQAVIAIGEVFNYLFDK